MNKTFKRRHFLKGASSIAVGLPYLAYFDTTAAAGNELPRRVLSFFTANGFDPAGRPTTTDLTGTTLAPLAGFRDRLTTIHGMRQTSRDLDPTKGDTAHYIGFSHALTGNNANPSNYRSSASMSYDQFAALTIRDGTTYRSIDAGGPSFLENGQNTSNGIFYPDRAFDAIFGGVALPDNSDPAETVAKLEKIRLEQQSILDFTLDSANSLRCRLGLEDRNRLDAHLQAIRELEVQVAATPSVCSLPERPRKWSYDEDFRSEKNATLDEYITAKIDIVTLAIACDLTRVASIGLSGAASGVPAKHLNISGSYHGLSHDTSDSARASIRKIDTYHAEKFGELLTKLDAIEVAPEVSVLDQSSVLWLSEAGSRTGHNIHSNEYVIAGGSGGYLNMGQRLDLEGIAHNNLLLELINASYPLEKAKETVFGNPGACDSGIPQLRA